MHIITTHTPPPHYQHEHKESITQTSPKQYIINAQARLHLHNTPPSPWTHRSICIRCLSTSSPEPGAYTPCVSYQTPSSQLARISTHTPYTRQASTQARHLITSLVSWLLHTQAPRATRYNTVLHIHQAT